MLSVLRCVPLCAEAGRDVLAVIAAAYRSAATGARITVDDALIEEIRDVPLG